MSKVITYSTINKRMNNEDCCLAFKLTPFVYEGSSKEVTILILSDGMGGHSYGEIASHITVSKTAELISKRILGKFILPELSKAKKIDFEIVLYEALVQVNHHIHSIKDIKGAGATLVVTIIIDNKYYWASVGDSLMYHWDSEIGKLNQVNDDHSVTGILVKQKIITPEFAKFHSAKHQIAYSIGHEIPSKDSESRTVGSGSLKNNDMLLLLSDGICGELTTEEIENEIRNTKSKKKSNYQKELIGKLIVENRKLGETDNQTIILYEHTKVKVVLEHDMKMFEPSFTEEYFRNELEKGKVGESEVVENSLELEEGNIGKGDDSVKPDIIEENENTDEIKLKIHDEPDVDSVKRTNNEIVEEKEQNTKNEQEGIENVKGI